MRNARLVAKANLASGCSRLQQQREFVLSPCYRTAVQEGESHFFSNLAALLLLPRLSVRYISCAKSIKTLRAQLLMAFFPLCSLPPLTMHRACKGGQGRLSFSLCFTGSRKYVGQRSVQPWGRGTTYGQGSRECPANLEKGNFFCSFEEKRGFKA